MKKTNITLALLFLLISPIFSQNFAGKRIYSGSLGLNLSSNSAENPNSSATSSSFKNKNFNLNSTFLTGKIRANNTYTAYGFNLGVTTSEIKIASSTYEKSSVFSVGPAIQLGKFVKVFDSFYYAPAFTGSITGSFGSRTNNNPNPNAGYDTSGFGIGMNLSPIRFIYQVKDNILLSMGLGYAELSYSYLHSQSKDAVPNTISTHNLILNGNISNFTGIGAFYLF